MFVDEGLEALGHFLSFTERFLYTQSQALTPAVHEVAPAVGILPWTGFSSLVREAARKRVRS